MAEDAASALATGQQPQSVVPTQKVDMAKSLAPYLSFTTIISKLLHHQEQIKGNVPPLPHGVLDSARDYEDHITWQPEPDVRDAVVVVYYNGKQSGFVLAGRSLREVEQHESLIQNVVLFGWIACLIVLYLYFVFASLVREQLSKLTSDQH